MPWVVLAPLVIAKWQEAQRSAARQPALNGGLKA